MQNKKQYITNGIVHNIYPSDEAFSEKQSSNYRR